MPTIDGGHIYLTCLIPVKRGGTVVDGGFSTHSHRLREELALLPTAQQSPETVDAGLVSPFARCRRTHFLRLFIVDQPMWNGRDPIDPLWNIVKGDNLKKQPPYDVLAQPWLILSADIDRDISQPDDGLAGWAEALWERTQPEMEAIFSHCAGFEDVGTASQFARWLKRCQLPTTMSFNGYYDGEPALKGMNLKLVALMVLAIAAGTVLLAALLVKGWWLLLAVLPGLGLGLYGAFGYADRFGSRPFPAFPDSSLDSVLKALWLQQRFGSFAEAAQGLSPDNLHAAFGHFLAEARPDDLSSAVSQPPGVVRSDAVPLPAPERNQVEAMRL